MIYVVSHVSSGRSVARLSRLLWEQEVASSNLAAPTFRIDYQCFMSCSDTFRTAFFVLRPNITIQPYNLPGIGVDCQLVQN
jgi:hypothetical protein